MEGWWVSRECGWTWGVVAGCGTCAQRLAPIVLSVPDPLEPYENVKTNSKSIGYFDIGAIKRFTIGLGLWRSDSSSFTGE